MVDIKKHPLIEEAYNVCHAIEECGASDKLTAAVIKASDLMQHIADYFPGDLPEKERGGDSRDWTASGTELPPTPGVSGEAQPLRDVKVSRTFGELPEAIRAMIEPHAWDNMNISEQRDWALKSLASPEGRK